MINNDWFEEWFDTQYYKILYGNRDSSEAKAFLKKLIETLNLKPDSKILDLACGRGRHSFELNQMGFDVLGVDLSQESIKEAKTFENQSLSFKVMDMRMLSFQNEFDAVFNLFTSIGYFEFPEDNHKVILGVQNALKPNGYFVIDFLNSEFVTQTLIPFEVKTIQNITFEISKEIESGFVYKNIKVIDGEKVMNFQEKVQLFTENDLISLIEKNGLKVENIFYNYKLNNSENKDRVIIISRL